MRQVVSNRAEVSHSFDEGRVGDLNKGAWMSVPSFGSAHGGGRGDQSQSTGRNVHLSAHY